MKNNSMKRTTILTTIVCLMPVLLGAILYPKLPDTIVTHWDANGVPNGWQSKFIGAIIFPGALAIINMLFPLLLKLDPKYKSMDRKVVTLLHWIIPVVAMVASGITLATALGKDVKVVIIGPMLLGLILTAIGNYLPKMSQSYTVGIKIPWTLHSEENWNKTHRMAGFLWMIGGIAMIIGGMVGLGAKVMCIVIILVAAPIIYSYALYRKGV